MTEIPGYSMEDLRTFETYCARLSSLLEMESPTQPSGRMCRHLKCGCGRAIPAGIPSEYRESIWALCPPCVISRELVGTMQKPGALDLKLDALYPAPPPDMMAAIRAATGVGRTFSPNNHHDWHDNER